MWRYLNMYIWQLLLTRTESLQIYGYRFYFILNFMYDIVCILLVYIFYFIVYQSFIVAEYVSLLYTFNVPMFFVTNGEK